MTAKFDNSYQGQYDVSRMSRCWSLYLVMVENQPIITNCSSSTIVAFALLGLFCKHRWQLPIGKSIVNS